MDFIFDGFQAIIDFIDQAPTLTDTFLERAAHHVVVFYLSFKLASMELAYSVAEFFLDAINLNQLVSSALNNLPPAVVGVLNFFKIPQAINMLISAYTTRFVMDAVS